MTTRPMCRRRHIHMFEGEDSQRLVRDADASRLDRWITQAETDIRDLERVLIWLRSIRAEKGP